MALIATAGKFHKGQTVEVSDDEEGEMEHDKCPDSTSGSSGSGNSGSSSSSSD